MMTEDLSGGCLNIPAWLRFLHRPLFHSLQAPHTLQCIYSPNRAGCYFSTWSLGVSVGRKTGLAERGPLTHPRPQTLSIVPPVMVPVLLLLPELSTNGSFGAILCSHKTLSALAVSCASPHTERKSLVLKGWEHWPLCLGDSKYWQPLARELYLSNCLS